MPSERKQPKVGKHPESSKNSQTFEGRSRKTRLTSSPGSVDATEAARPDAPAACHGATLSEASGCRRSQGCTQTQQRGVRRDPQQVRCNDQLMLVWLGSHSGCCWGLLMAAFPDATAAQLPVPAPDVPRSRVSQKVQGSRAEPHVQRQTFPGISGVEQYWESIISAEQVVGAKQPPPWGAEGFWRRRAAPRCRAACRGCRCGCPAEFAPPPASPSPAAG